MTISATSEALKRDAIRQIMERCYPVGYNPQRRGVRRHLPSHVYSFVSEVGAVSAEMWWLHEQYLPGSSPLSPPKPSPTAPGGL